MEKKYNKQFLLKHTFKYLIKNVTLNLLQTSPMGSLSSGHLFLSTTNPISIYLEALLAYIKDDIITSYNLLYIVFAYILILFNLAVAHPECNIEFSPCLKAAYSHQPQISPLKVVTGIKSSCINVDGTSRNQCHINVSLANRSTPLQSTKKAHAVVGYDEKEQNGRIG